MRKLALLAAGCSLAACAANPSQDDRMAAQQHLAALLAGKVADRQVECVPDYHSSSRTILTPQAIAFEANPGLVYVSSTAGNGCEGIVGSRYSLVTTSHGTSGICAGDQVQVRDLQTGLMAGACTLQPFVPYKRP